SPLFFKQPFRYIKWVSIHKPAYFYSIIIGTIGPVAVFVVPPIRRYIGDENRSKVPQTYPIPRGPRPRPSGFEDE
ncbi:hypothetical protein P280DRAFT_415249, partial [Massarina eburnea CBS 473.64]